MHLIVLVVHLHAKRLIEPLKDVYYVLIVLSIKEIGVLLAVYFVTTVVFVATDSDLDTELNVVRGSCLDEWQRSRSAGLESLIAIPSTLVGSTDNHVAAPCHAPCLLYFHSALTGQYSA